MATIHFSRGPRPCRCRLSIRNASVMPVRKRKIAGPSPPKSCEIKYGPLSRKSLREKAWKTCPCSMISTAMPRVQSKNARRPGALLRDFESDGIYRLLLRIYVLNTLGQVQFQVG